MMMFYGFFAIMGYYMLSLTGAAEPADENNCKVCQNAKCTSLMIFAADIACQVTYTDPRITTTADRKSPEDDDTYEGVLTNPTKIIVSATKKIQCGKVDYALKWSNKAKKRRVWKNFEDPGGVGVGDKQDGCILYKLENVTTATRLLVELPLPMKPGMMLSVNGCYSNGDSSIMTITLDPVHPTNMWKWLHVRPYWLSKKLVVMKGFSRTFYRGKFPISDPSNFTLAAELTTSKTKIYADGTLIKTVRPISVIKDCNLLGYKTLHVEVQKKDGRCVKKDGGSP